MRGARHGHTRDAPCAGAGEARRALPGCWRVAEWKPGAFVWLFACDFESMGSVSRFSNTAGSSSLARVSVGARFVAGIRRTSPG